MSLQIVFAGTSPFGIPALKELMNSSHEVLAVYTKIDSPSGRGRKLTFSPIKQFMLNDYPSVPIFQPSHLKIPEVQSQIKDLGADVMVVIAYGLILPKAVLSLFKFGCINVHASLLPRWRGAAPIQRAILAGDKETGVTIMQMDEGLDTGALLNAQHYAINDKDTAIDVHGHLATLGASSLLATLEALEKGTTKPQPQNDKFASYAAKITKEEANINWQNSADYIDRQIRAFHPWPIAFTYFSNQLLKIWEARVISLTESQAIPGTILTISDKGIDVATGQGIIRLLTLQNPGGKPISVANFLNAKSHLIVPGKSWLGEENAFYS